MPVRIRSVTALVVVIAALPAAAAAQEGEAREHPLAPAIRIARESRAALEDVKDFQAVFSKQETVEGRMRPAQIMLIKLRREPFSVYLRFHRPHEGREVIYVDGKNDGNILAHGAGIKSLAGTIAIPVNSPRALAESRFPITMIGMRTMVETIIEQWESESKYGECEVKYYPNAKLQDMECKVIESSHPRPRRQFPYHITRLYIDKKTNLPVRVEQYGFPQRAGEKPPLASQYTYSKLRINNGFTDIDFDTRNPNYDF